MISKASQYLKLDVVQHRTSIHIAHVNLMISPTIKEERLMKDQIIPKVKRHHISQIKYRPFIDPLMIITTRLHSDTIQLGLTVVSDILSQGLYKTLANHL